jgi:hypothetical protein
VVAFFIRGAFRGGDTFHFTGWIQEKKCDGSGPIVHGDNLDLASPPITADGNNNTILHSVSKLTGVLSDWSLF